MTDVATLEIRGLEASVEGKQILKGIDLVVRQGETHALMGPNGSGKSTLANVLMGRPGYTLTAGRVLFNGEDIAKLSADKRAQRGLFLAMQYPVEIPGVSVVNFLRTAYKNVKGEEINALAFRKHLKEKMNLLGVEDAMVNRYVNQGFSGGEKKKNEVLQLAVLEPQIAVLDETDSGLDIDSLKSVATGVAQRPAPTRRRSPPLPVILTTSRLTPSTPVTHSRTNVRRREIAHEPRPAGRGHPQGARPRGAGGCGLGGDRRGGDGTAVGGARRRAPARGFPDPGAEGQR
jgi:Fe-S cluster assembly ATP-binding protein